MGSRSPSHIAKREDYARCIAGLEKMGYRVLEADNLYSETYGYGATPEERAADFNQLAANPEVGMIFFDGGEGGNELLPLIDFDLLRAHPKRVCSYSDGTTILEAIWAKTGLEVYYGQSPGMAADYSEYDASQFLTVAAEGTAERFVSGQRVDGSDAGQGAGRAHGRLCAQLCASAGDGVLSRRAGEKHVLFIEDHEMFGGEAYVSAMLSHIEQQPFMQSVTGLLFGHYSERVRPNLLARLRRLGHGGAFPSLPATISAMERTTPCCPLAARSSWIRTGRRFITARVYLKNSLRLHHGVFSAISASENLDLAPLNLRFPSLN